MSNSSIPSTPQRKPYKVRYQTDQFPSSLWSEHYDYEAAVRERSRLQSIVAQSTHAEAKRAIRNIEIV